jgi:hypothetical protein
MRLAKIPLGLPINFNVTKLQNGIKRFVLYFFVIFVVSEREFQAEVAGASMTASMAASSFSSFTGLTRCSEKPACRLF